MMMTLRCEGRQLTVAVMVSLEEEERQQKATADEHTAVNVATVHKSTNTEIHFYKMHKSTDAPNKV